MAIAKTSVKFDQGAFAKALKAADFERCHELVDGRTTREAVLASASLALRERRYVDVIGLLSNFPEASDSARLGRDVMLGAALGYTRDYVAGRRLIERGLHDLVPDDPRYDDAHYHKSAIAWMQHEHREAEEACQLQLKSGDANSRARAHIMLSWIALRRGDVLQQVEKLKNALDELDGAEEPDEYFRANALAALGPLCRDLPIREAAERTRHTYDTLPWSNGLQLERFQVTRCLAVIDELDGNELAAFGAFKRASVLAPSQHWSVLCLLDRARLAKNTGEKVFSVEQLEEAHQVAQRVSWGETTGEERSALLILSELYADQNPAIAEQYLARFRSMSSSVLPIWAHSTDRRVRGFEAYSQGISWLRMGDTEEGKNSLMEAWNIFEDFGYGWRAALCALGLHEATNDRRWLDRANRRIAPWPNSWIAKRLSEMNTSTVVPLEKIPSAKREVLELVREGRRNAEIAETLGRSPNTVRNQVAQLFQLFDVKSRAELVAILSKPVVPITRLAARNRNQG